MTIERARRRISSPSFFGAAILSVSLGFSPTQASARISYIRPHVGGGFVHMGHPFEHRGFARGGFGGSGFGGGGFGGAVGTAGLALGLLGAVIATASAAADEEPQPQCGLARQVVLRGDGTYYYRQVRVCR